jgi:hypothetical protein
VSLKRTEEITPALSQENGMFENIGWIVEAKIQDRKRDEFETVTKGGDALKAKLTAIGLTTLVAVHSAHAGGSREVVLTSEVEWEKLNPARGDKSPQAATLWGDRKGTVSTGFLAKLVDGFSSPPHIHNATYRAVVISGSIHYVRTDGMYEVVPAK